MEERLYTPEEAAQLEAALRGGQHPACPRCAVPMQRLDVPPKSEVSYVRDRTWLTCGRCGRSLVVDRRWVEGR